MGLSLLKSNAENPLGHEMRAKSVWETGKIGENKDLDEPCFPYTFCTSFISYLHMFFDLNLQKT